MTKWECAVVMTYTDTCMLQGEDLGIFYEYVNSLMGRPVCTHEIPALEEEIRKRAKKDFEEICRSAGEDPWNPISKKEPPKNTPLWLTIRTRSGWKPAVVAGGPPRRRMGAHPRHPERVHGHGLDTVPGCVQGRRR